MWDVGDEVTTRSFVNALNQARQSIGIYLGDLLKANRAQMTGVLIIRGRQDTIISIKRKSRVNKD